MTSILSAFPFLGEQSFATPGAWNSPLSIISANIAAINADVGAVSGVTISPPSGNTIQMPSDLSISGYLSVGKGVSIGTQVPSIAEPVALTIGVNSGISDYLYLNDSSNLRSDYLIGSHAGGTADGLNIFDVSGNTMIVSFSKQSVRFWQRVIAPLVDIGGQTFNVLSYGAIGDGSTDDWGAINDTITAVAAAGAKSRVILFPSGYTYSISSALIFGSSAISGLEIRGDGFGSSILFAPNMKFYAPASGQSAGIYIGGPLGAQQVRLRNLKVDGNRFNQTSPNAMVMCDGANNGGPDEFLVSDLFLVNGYGTVAYGSALRLQNVNTAQVNNIIARNCASDGINVFGSCNKIQISSVIARLNGILGLDIEAGAGGRPASIAVTNFYGSENSAANWAVLGSDDVTLVNMHSVLGGNNNCARIQNCRRVTLTNFSIRGSMVGSANTVGLGLDDEGSGTSNTDILIANGAISAIGGPGIVVKNAQNVQFVNISLSTCSGSGISFSSGVSQVSVIGSTFTLLGGPNLSGITSILTRVVMLNQPATDDLLWLPTGTAIAPPYSFASDTSLGWFRSGVSAIGLSYGQLQLPAGTGVQPSLAISSESSLGFYRSAVSTLAQSYGSTVLAQGAVADRVGIGTPTPGDKVDINASLANARNGLRILNTVDGNSSARWQLFADGAAGQGIGEMFATSFGGIGNQFWLYSSGANTPLILGTQGSERLRVQSAGSILASQQIVGIDGSAINPALAYTSDISLGFFRSGVQTIAQSLGTFNLATNAVRLSMRTIAASALTASAANTNVAVNEAVFTIQASGASFVINSGGTTWIFNSSASAKNT